MPEKPEKPEKPEYKFGMKAKTRQSLKFGRV